MVSINPILFKNYSYPLLSDAHVLSLLSSRAWGSYGQIQPIAQEEGEWEGRVAERGFLGFTDGAFLIDHKL